MKPTLLVANSKVSISRIGFGCARIYGKTELRASAQLIESALACGIRHFDTAPSYGNGQSEAVLGTVLAGIRDVTISTKIGIPRPYTVSGSHAWSVPYRRFVRPLMSRFPGTKARLLELIGRTNGLAVPQHIQARRHLSREEILRELDESLRQLRRSCTDLYLIHEPDQFELTDELKHVFESLQRNGTIGAYGLAWGRPADSGIGFGSVIQGRYAINLPTKAIKGETLIFHGILRHSWQESDAQGKNQGAGMRIHKVLDTYPNAGVVFSASTPNQIRRVMHHFQENPLQ